MSALRKWVERRRARSRHLGYGPIGVHVGNKFMHFVQLRVLASGSVEIRSCESLRYPGTRPELLSSTGAVRNLVRRAMRAGRFRGRNVVSAMPRDQIRVMSVSYPASSPAGDASSIATVMADRLEGALSDYVIDYVPVRHSARDGERLALVAVSRRQHVNDYLDCLEAAGLRVDHLETGSLALRRVFGLGCAAEDGFKNIVVINVGDSSTQLTTISGRRLLADQQLKFGLDTIVDSLVRLLDLTPAAALELLRSGGLDTTRPIAADGTGGLDAADAATLAEVVTPALIRLTGEIQRAFVFADSESHESSGNRVFVVGDVARWPGFISLLGMLAKLPMQTIGPEQLRFIAGTSEALGCDDERMEDLSIAVGLALRGIAVDE